MILAGDVGGTKTRLAICQLDNGRIIRQQTDTFISRDYSCLEEVVQDFINKYDVSVTKSCFGVPGPVVLLGSAVLWGSVVVALLALVALFALLALLALLALVGCGWLWLFCLFWWLCCICLLCWLCWRC